MAKIQLNGSMTILIEDYLLDSVNLIEGFFRVAIILNEYIQSNLSTTGTLGTKESGRRGEVAIMER